MRMHLRAFLTFLTLLIAQIARAQTPRLDAIPIDLMVRFVPPPVRAEDGRHLLYELRASNFGRADLTLDKVEVMSAGGRVLRSYSDSALLRALARPGVTVTDRRLIGPGLTAVIFIDVPLPSGVAIDRLTHRLTFAPIVPPNSDTQSVVEGASIDIPREAPLRLDPPLAGGRWIALHGLSNESSHRRTLLTINGTARISQRFAIDWTRAGDDGQVFHGDPAKNSNWVPYGADVLAVADGKIVEVQDGIPENDPTSSTRAVPIDLKTAGGNYVILQIATDRYAFYAHLQPHSICFRSGDRVHRGDVLAKLGNSGQSDAPHLHFQLMDLPSLLAADGVPVALDFRLLGHVASLGVLTDGSGWKPDTPPRTIQGQMPLENAVVEFAATRSSASGCRRSGGRD